MLALGVIPDKPAALVVGLKETRGAREVIPDGGRELATSLGITSPNTPRGASRMPWAMEI